MLRERMIPPGDIADVLPSPQAPVLIDRGFFVNSKHWDGIVPEGVDVPITPNGAPMSPIDAATGTPLPIVASFNDKQPNRHHAHFYKWQYTGGTLALQAVRYSRLQWSGRLAHTTYHQTFDGTELPQTPEDEYCITILNCAGFLAPYGVKIENRKVTIGELTTLERKKLRRPGMIIKEQRPEAQATIGKYLMQYALVQDFSYADQFHIEEFLGISDEAMRLYEEARDRKLWLAMRLTNRAIGLAVDPINAHYQEARKTYSLRKHMPPTPWDVAKLHIAGREPDYVEALEERLTEYVAAA